MPVTDSSLERIVTSIQTSSGVNALLWLLSLVGGVGVAAWVLWGGPVEEARTRASAVEQLWPIGLTWAASLVGKSKVTSDQKRELVRADAMLRVARLQPGAVVMSSPAGQAMVTQPGTVTQSGEGAV